MTTSTAFLIPSMMKLKFFWLTLIFLVPVLAFGQTDTSTQTVRVDQEDTTQVTSKPKSLKPGQIAYRSLYLPGYGQWTNKQYWKTPIMAGAVGTGLYGFAHYSIKASQYRQAFAIRIDTFPSTVDQYVNQLTNLELANQALQSTDYQRYSLFFTIYAHGVNTLDAYANAMTDQNPDRHSPTKAAYLSALFPGLGQVYNRKYWKLPLVYGLLGTTVGFVVYNDGIYKDFTLAYVARTDEDPATQYETPLTASYATNNLREKEEQYKKYRDMSYVATFGAYLLIMVDAIVDAHLHDFNVDDDLSYNANHWSNRLSLNPFSTGFSSAAGGYNGFSLRFEF